MNRFLKLAFIFLLLAFIALLLAQDRYNTALINSSYTALARGTVSEFESDYRVHKYYKDLAGSYEADLDRLQNKEVNLDSMWNLMGQMLQGWGAEEVLTYYQINPANAEFFTERKVAEFSPVAKASDQLDSVLTALIKNYYSIRREVSPTAGLNYFTGNLVIEKEGQARLWLCFQHYSEATASLLDIILDRKLYIDSIRSELQVISTASKAELLKGVSWPQNISWRFNHLRRPVKIHEDDLSYLMSKIRRAVPVKLPVLRNELAKLNSLFAGNGKFELYGKLYSLENISSAEFHSILKAILIHKHLTDQALVACYESPVEF